MKPSTRRFSGMMLVLAAISLFTASCYETSYQNRYHHHSRRYYEHRHMPPPPGVNFELDVRH